MGHWMSSLSVDVIHQYFVEPGVLCHALLLIEVLLRDEPTICEGIEHGVAKDDSVKLIETSLVELDEAHLFNRTNSYQILQNDLESYALPIGMPTASCDHRHLKEQGFCDNWIATL